MQPVARQAGKIAVVDRAPSAAFIYAMREYVGAVTIEIAARLEAQKTGLRAIMVDGNRTRDLGITAFTTTARWTFFPLVCVGLAPLR